MKTFGLFLCACWAMLNSLDLLSAENKDSVRGFENPNTFWGGSPFDEVKNNKDAELELKIVLLLNDPGKIAFIAKNIEVL